ncbi:tyrosine-type recombinase/integrase [Glutamicibacter arilaitensis]|uniref:tyrosine-type recombinase/integrase n=1 Tax=Glutamicibacter arilaitensis TaxID=256701 RepID=UPI00384CDDA3
MKDVQIGRGRIRVERAVVFVKGGRSVVGPAENVKARTVPIPSYISAMLEPLVKDRWPNELLFKSARGHQIRPNNFKHRDFDSAIASINATAEAKKYPGDKSALTIPKGLWVHDLRHTAASWLVQSGASVKVVQLMLGHAAASIILATYAGLFDQDLDDVSTRTQALLSDE